MSATVSHLHLVDARVKPERKGRLTLEQKRMIAGQIIKLQDRLASTRATVRAIAKEWHVDTATLYRWANLERDGLLVEAEPDVQITAEMVETFYRFHGEFLATYRCLVERGLWTKSESSFRQHFHAEVDRIIERAASMDEEAWRLLGAYLLYEVPFRNAEWQLDTKSVPVEIITSAGERVKPTVTAVVESRSRMKLGCAVHLGPANSEAVSRCLVNGITIRTHPYTLADGSEVEIAVGGAPDLLLHDNATEILSDHNAAALTDWAVVSLPLPERTPNPKGKIENWNRTIDNWASMFGPWTSGLRDLHQHEIYRDVDGLLVMHEEDFLKLFEQFLYYENFERPHRSLGGKTPFEVWAADAVEHLTEPHQGLRPVRTEVLERHLLVPAGLRKTERGWVWCDKARYVATELAHVKAKKVEVRFSRHDKAFVECWHGDEFVCRAWNTAGLTDEQIEAILDDRYDIQDQIRRLRRLGVARLVADQATLVADHHDPVEDDPDPPTRSTADAAPADVAGDDDRILADFDKTFSTEPS